MAKKQRDVNYSDLVKAIKLTWSSLESHLDSAIAPRHKKDCCNASVGNPEFHRMCVKEYAETINILADALQL